jgi:hypothetical protein
MAWWWSSGSAQQLPGGSICGSRVLYNEKKVNISIFEFLYDSRLRDKKSQVFLLYRLYSS